MSVDRQIAEQRALLDAMDNGETTQIGDLMDCKEYGCTQEATATLGPYAGLCDEHKEIARQKRIETARGGGSATRASTNGAGLTDQIRDLIPAARRVDRARKRLTTLPEEPDPKAAVDEAMRRYQAVSNEENLAKLSEAVTAATRRRNGHSKRAKAEADLATAEREFKAELAQFARKVAA